MADVTGISGEYTLPACTFGAPSGQQFKAWKVGGVEKAVGDKITVTANTTVTAVWEDIPLIFTPPSITVQPSDQTVREGNSASFAIVATGNPTPSYQWWINRNDNNGWVEIPGATEASYTTSITTISNNGYRYRCYVSNSEGNITSTEVLLTVTSGPIDPPSSENKITGIEAGQVFTQGDTVTFIAIGSGIPNDDPIIGDKWWLPSEWSVNPFGDFADGFTQSFSTAEMNTGSHTLTVTFAQQRYNGTTWENTGLTDQKSVSFTLEAAPEQPIPPSITDPSENRIITVSVGKDTLLSVDATGTYPLVYRWQMKKGNSWQDISGAEAAQYTVYSVSQENDGELYRCIVKNEVGIAISPVFTLRIDSIDTPATGDASMLWLWATLAVISLAGFSILICKARKK